MSTKPLRFIRRGEIVLLENVTPSRTLLDLLREDLRCTAPKEGCGEGDCGACTVVLAEPEGDALRWRAVNACIRLAHSVDGMALWTAADLDSDPLLRPVPPASADARTEDAPPPAVPLDPPTRPALHPVQQALVDAHGSQCGFCTPGFVMSLFAQYQARGAAPMNRAEAQVALSGNLCRCTGYRPILDAACRQHEAPRVALDEARLKRLLAGIAPATDPAPKASGTGDPAGPTSPRYDRPTGLEALLALRAAHPDAQLVAGATDLGLWITKQHRRFEHLIDLTAVRELRRVETYPHHLAIGAAVTLEDAYAALTAERPMLRRFAERFAGLPVRNSGTLGGNVANGSPIGDSMPLLIALGASVVLMSTRGHREMPLQDFYTGYRKNRLASDEVLAWIKVPRPVAGERLAAWKVSKRADDDISAVCLAARIELVDGRISKATIGAGGVAATPARAVQAEAALVGQVWSRDIAERAALALQTEFAPISDMRASADYRRAVLGNLMRRFWLESPEAGIGLPVTLEALP